MAWVEIPNSNLAPGAPIRAVDVRAIRDNVIAMAGGATGAPRFASASFAPPVASGAYRVCTVVEQGSALVAPMITTSAVEDRYYVNPAIPRITSAPEILRRHVAVTTIVPGTVRCLLEIAGEGSVRVVVAGSQVVEWTPNSYIYRVYSVDVTLPWIGAPLVFQQKSKNTGELSYIKNIAVFSSAPSMAVA